MEDKQDLYFKVQRYTPGEDQKPRMQDFTIPYKKGMTLLEGLIYIKETIDNTLCFRCSCRMGICGSCGVLVNNLPMLACHTPIEELETDRITVKSLPNFPIVRDMVADLTPLFEKHKSVKPYVIGPNKETLERPQTGLAQSPEELESFVQFAYCVKCGLCMAACPTVATDEHFLGPQPLAAVYRYCTDRRDQGEKERFGIVNAPHGLWLCHLAGACSEVCPKGVDPAFAIQLLKRGNISASLGMQKKRIPAPMVAPSKDVKPKIEVPKFTVKQS
ncbi:MAG: succinate dehydrogenase iron-sulfur subunit [Dehalococcoidia bacterium]|nr:succinate dehydrogenase iron-sulfur subunit [Dehalococcoidia bacterium]